MRELTFDLVYERGADPVADVFIEFPSLSANAIASCVRRDRLWRVERFTGPRAALDRVERHRLDPDAPHEEMTDTECQAVREHGVLERTPSTLVLYTFVTKLHQCDSVLAQAARRLDLGFVLQSRRREHRHQWRLLLRSATNVGVFRREAAAHLDDGIRLEIGRLGPVDSWNDDSLATVSLPPEQRETLRAAVDRGYYETPREITVSDLADRLDLPASTVSYRLRQAEAQLAKGYLSRFGSERVVGDPAD
ncbi:helix-turn-helix domain-containing protein [Halobaculum marinum]|uniref:Helix-turn-helix domain-containing protein n=1 Tax=Halobaculum marinum TaxID=3031996 RepID=A0ABD5WYD1_9EURY|nr:helix-turn-helix domain-containing protein [Halobaculum sp. DT55]